MEGGVIGREWGGVVGGAFGGGGSRGVGGAAGPRCLRRVGQSEAGDLVVLPTEVGAEDGQAGLFWVVSADVVDGVLRPHGVDERTRAHELVGSQGVVVQVAKALVHDVADVGRRPQGGAGGMGDFETAGDVGEG